VRKILPSLIMAALVALVIPAASADVCVGSSCGGSGGSGGSSGTSTPFNRLSISNGSTVISSKQGQTSGVAEGGTCSFTIHRSKPYHGNTTVFWHTKDGTATHVPESSGESPPPPDYNATSGSVTFNPEQPANFTVQVQTNADGPDGTSNENFFVKLGKTSNGDIVDPSGGCVIHVAA